MPTKTEDELEKLHATEGCTCVLQYYNNTVAMHRTGCALNNNPVGDDETTKLLMKRNENAQPPPSAVPYEAYGQYIAKWRGIPERSLFRGEGQ